MAAFETWPIPILWHKYQRVFSFCYTLVYAKHAGRFDCLMSSLIVMPMDNASGRGHCGSPEMQGSQPNPQRNYTLEMDAIKQIKICAEYQNMVSKASAGLSGTPDWSPWLPCPGILHRS